MNKSTTVLSTDDVGVEGKKLYVIKIGGNVIDNSANLDCFLKEFTALEGYKILVHGGGKAATQFSESLGIEPNWLMAAG